jgi:hypothetical protein
VKLDRVVYSHLTKKDLPRGWMVGIHLTFVFTGLIFALSEKYMHQQSH